MSILDAGSTIRDARQKSGLTLEKLSEGICSVQALNRIEKGKSGVSPSTFHALMEHTGRSFHALPVFENWTDYECFTYANEAKFYVNSWQLEKAYDVLAKEEALEWNHNIMNYQEWLLNYCKLIIRTYQYDHAKLKSIIEFAISLTRESIDFSDIRNLLLSQVEMELLLLYIYEKIQLNDPTNCISLYEQLNLYLDHSNFSDKVNNYLYAANALCFVRYLIKFEKSYQEACDIINQQRSNLIRYGEDTLLYDYSFLLGLCLYKLGNEKDAMKWFWSVLFASDVLQTNYTINCLSFLREKKIPIDTYYDLSTLRLHQINSFDYPKMVDVSAYSNGIFELDEYKNITFGRLIRELRTRQKLSQDQICAGLCAKSTLSKIENGTLAADTILAGTLLQRLGVCDRAFSFYGNNSENAFETLKFKLLHPELLSKEDYHALIKQLSEVIDDKNPTMKQVYSLQIYDMESHPQKQIDFLWEALSYTISDFDIYRFYQYRFSWIELTILNNLAYLYRYTETPEKGTALYQKIIDYKEMNHLSTLFEFTIYPITYAQRARFLYSQNHHKLSISLAKHNDLSLLYASFPSSIEFMIYYCQAFFHTGDVEHGTYFIYAAHALCKLINIPNLIDEIVEEMENDFHADLNILHQ